MKSFFLKMSEKIISYCKDNEKRSNPASCSLGCLLDDKYHDELKSEINSYGKFKEEEFAKMRIKECQDEMVRRMQEAQS